MFEKELIAFVLLIGFFHASKGLDLSAPGCGWLFKQRFIPIKNTTFGYSADVVSQPPRVGTGTAWCPTDPSNSFMQVDLGKVANISGVETQGQDYKVGYFAIQYSSTASNFNYIKNGTGYIQLFKGHNDPEFPKRQDFEHTIAARYVRFRLQSKPPVCLKVEILGCITVDGVFSGWTDWTRCSRDCDGGKRARTRTCSNPSPANGGTQCVGETLEEEECNMISCSAPAPFVGGGGGAGIDDWMWILLWLLAVLIFILMLIICLLCCCWHGCLKSFCSFTKKKKKTTVIKNFYHGEENVYEESGDEVQSIVLEMREEVEEPTNVVTFSSDKEDETMFYAYGLYEIDKIDDSSAIYDSSRKVFEYSREDDLTTVPYL